MWTVTVLVHAVVPALIASWLALLIVHHWRDLARRPLNHGKACIHSLLWDPVVITELGSQTNQWQQTPPIFFSQWDLPSGHLSVTWKRRNMACRTGVRNKDNTPVHIVRLKSFFGETLCRGTISHNCPARSVWTPMCGDTFNDFCNSLVCQRCL